jgi:hypothetical protein
MIYIIFFLLKRKSDLHLFKYIVLQQIIKMNI